MLSDAGIVTACDANYFPGLLMLYRSVQESYPCPIACYDLGLTPAQLAEAGRHSDLRILPLPDDPVIDRIKIAMAGGPPLAKQNKRAWPLWICPWLIKYAPFRDVIWMDCDLVVFRKLKEIFDAISQAPFFTPENKAPELTPNHPRLYELMPISGEFNPALPVVNAGVSGWRKDRDAMALRAYTLPVERAIDDPDVRNAISWHDQGALIWAIQSCGLEHCVMPTNEWNLCVNHTRLARNSLPWNENFLERARAEVPNANIVHWNGAAPPWTMPTDSAHVTLPE